MINELSDMFKAYISLGLTVDDAREASKREYLMKKEFRKTNGEESVKQGKKRAWRATNFAGTGNNNPVAHAE